jgi:hypothetical protein
MARKQVGIFKKGFDVYQVRTSRNVIRILPPTWKNYEHYGFDVWVHYGDHVQLCRKMMLGKRCSFCNGAKKAMEADRYEDAQILRAQKRVVVWVLDRREKKPRPRLYSMPWTTDRQIMELAFTKRSGRVRAIDHPDKGYDITFTRSGNGAKTKFIDFKIDRRLSPIARKLKDRDEVMDFVMENPVPKTLNLVKRK